MPPPDGVPENVAQRTWESWLGEIHENTLRKSNYAKRELSKLEASRCLELALWPAWSENVLQELYGNTSQYAVSLCCSLTLSTIAVINEKARQRLDVFAALGISKGEFGSAASISRTAIATEDVDRTSSAVPFSSQGQKFPLPPLPLIAASIASSHNKSNESPTAEASADLERSHVSNLDKLKFVVYASWLILLKGFDVSNQDLVTAREKAELLRFLAYCYSTLEKPEIRRICVPFCGILSWTFIGDNVREDLLSNDKIGNLSQLWKVVQRRRTKIAKRMENVSLARAVNQAPSYTLLTELQSPDLSSSERNFLFEQLAFPLLISLFLRFVENDLDALIDDSDLQSLQVEDLMKTPPLYTGCGGSNLERRNQDIDISLLTKVSAVSTALSNESQVPDADPEFGAVGIVEAVRAEDVGRVGSDNLLVCERFLEFIIGLLSQLLVRQFCRPLISAFQLVVRLKLSRLIRHREADLVRQLTDIVAGYQQFGIDDATGESYDAKRLQIEHFRTWKRLQLAFFQKLAHLPVLRKAAIESIGKYDSPTQFRKLIRDLDCSVLLRLGHSLHLFDLEAFLADITENRTRAVPIEDTLASLNKVSSNQFVQNLRRLIVEVLVFHLCRKPDELEAIRQIPLFPTETVLWDPSSLPTDNYDGTYPLALPRLSLQFLSLRDFLIRNFHLYRLESSYQIREDIQETIWHLRPTLSVSSTAPGRSVPGELMRTSFLGRARMGCPIEHFSITFIKPPGVGSDLPSDVRAELSIDLRNVPKEAKSGWDSLRQFDVVFLVAIRAPFERYEGRPADLSFDFPEKFGIIAVRGAEIVEVVDEEGQVLGGDQGVAEPAGSIRSFRVKLDSPQYAKDMQAEGEDVYPLLNVVIRRNPAENTFKSVLSTIRQLINESTNVVLPSWFERIFLGFGRSEDVVYYRRQPSPDFDIKANESTSTGASATSTFEIRDIDFFDTFLDATHIKESLVNVKNIDLSNYKNAGSLVRCAFSPTISAGPSSLPQILQHPGNDTVTVHAYDVQYSDLLESKLLRKNKIRFTRAQIEAIRSGVNPGLTLVVGPPGTGKTDVAVQTVNLLYRNFPNQRILLVAQSNQALNDLFEKIAALDIDERYLLRLGMGEKELRESMGRSIDDPSKKDFSRFGRINHMLQRRLDLLQKVKELAEAMYMPFTLITSCDTAIQFYRSYVLSRINRYRGAIDELAAVPDSERDLEAIITQQQAEDDSQWRAALVLPPAARFTADADPISRRRDRNETEGRQEVSAMSGEQRALERKAAEEREVAERAMVEMQAANLFEERKSLERALLEQAASGKISYAEALFPFSRYFKDVPGGLFPKSGSAPTETQQGNLQSDLRRAEECFSHLRRIFADLEECRAYELLRTSHDRGEYLLTRQARVIAMTCTHAALAREQLLNLRLSYDTLIVEEAAQITEITSLVPMVLQRTPEGENSRLRRIVLLGDHHQLPPVVQNQGVQQYSKLDQPMFTRLIRLGIPYVQLDKQGRCRPSLRELFGWYYADPTLGDLPSVTTEAPATFKSENPGFCFDYQFINVDDFRGQGERAPLPHYFQNVGEAEFSVALFMFMRLLGYPASSIVILTTYNGQKDLIRDLLNKRCAWNPLIGVPAVVSTVDKFQGQQADYVILSLVRTKFVGHLRDIRRLIVALSRARLGLYVLGRAELFYNCAELRPTMEKFAKRPLSLAVNLSAGEKYGEAYFNGSGRSLGLTGPMTLIPSVQQMWDCCAAQAEDSIPQTVLPS